MIPDAIVLDAMVVCTDNPSTNDGSVVTLFAYCIADYSLV